MTNIGFAVNPKVEFFTFFYKKAPVLLARPPYIPLMVGNRASGAAKDMKGDDIGINISVKNKYYSELTGIFWVWKNTRQDIVGCMHYRRFLTRKKEPLLYKQKRLLYYLLGLYKKRSGIIYTKNARLFRENILTEDEALELLKNYDLILPRRRMLRHSVKKHYERCHNKQDLEFLRTLIKERCPEYLGSFEAVLADNRLFANNLFIMSRADFDRCMEWLFDLLFEFERRVRLSEYTGYQERIMGFLAERLLNVWFDYQKLKIKELPMIYFKHFKYCKG